jgi:hypothetical protein
VQPMLRGTHACVRWRRARVLACREERVCGPSVRGDGVGAPRPRGERRIYARAPVCVGEQVPARNHEATAAGQHHDDLVVGGVVGADGWLDEDRARRVVAMWQGSANAIQCAKCGVSRRSDRRRRRHGQDGAGPPDAHLDGPRGAVWRTERHVTPGERQVAQTEQRWDTIVVMHNHARPQSRVAEAEGDARHANGAENAFADAASVELSALRLRQWVDVDPHQRATRKEPRVRESVHPENERVGADATDGASVAEIGPAKCVRVEGAEEPASRCRKWRSGGRARGVRGRRNEARLRRGFTRRTAPRCAERRLHPLAGDESRDVVDGGRRGDGRRE